MSAPSIPSIPSNPKLSPPVHTDWSRDPRHNALVHGLTANFPLDDAEHRIMAEEIDTWTRELGPTCEAESAIIHSAAIARVRVFRAARAEAAAVRQARRHAEAHHLAKERAKVRKLARSLAADPAETRDRLEATRLGREYLAGRWRSIESVLDQGLDLADHRGQVMNLMGCRDAAPGPHANPDCRALWAALHLADQDDPDVQTHGNDDAKGATGRPRDQRPLPTPAAARDQLRELATTQRARLSQLDERSASDPAQQESDSLDRHDRSEINLVLVDPEARLRQRYAKEANHDLRTNLNLLKQVRRDRRQAEADERKDAYRRPPRDSYEPAEPARPRKRPDPGSAHANASTETNGCSRDATLDERPTFPFPAGNTERRTGPVPPPLDWPSDVPDPAAEPRSWSNPDGH